MFFQIVLVMNLKKMDMPEMDTSLTLPHMGDFEQLHTWEGGHFVPPPYFLSMFYYC